MIISSALMIIIMAVIGFTGYNGIRHVKDHLNNISIVRLPSLDYLLQVDRDLQQLLVELVDGQANVVDGQGGLRNAGSR